MACCLHSGGPPGALRGAKEGKLSSQVFTFQTGYSVSLIGLLVCVYYDSQTVERYTIHWSRFSIKFSYFPTFFIQAFSLKLDVWTEAFSNVVLYACVSVCVSVCVCVCMSLLYVVCLYLGQSMSVSVYVYVKL